MFHTICENTDFFRYFCKRFSPFWAKRNGLDNILTDNMLDFNTIEKLDKIATPFYYYDMDLFHKTVDHVSELAAKYDLKVHYAIKANVERRLLEYISSTLPPCCFTALQ